MSSSFTPDASMSNRAPGTMPRRPSYAAIVSGPGSGISQAINQRSNAFSNLLNLSDIRYENYDSYPSSSSIGEFSSSRNGAESLTGSGSNGWGLNGNSQLPSFSRAFGLYTHAYENMAHEGRREREQFFIPSYLQGSHHMERLEEAYRAKQAAQQDSNSTHSSQPGSLSTSASSIHTKAPSHRGMTYDLIEKAPPLDDDRLPPLPSKWNQSDKHSALEVGAEGLEVKLSGATPVKERDHEACTIRADRYMPAQVGLYYYEVTILSKKREESTIGIGFSAKGVSLSRVPGWEPDSWAYHGDDGNSFCCQQTGKSYGPKFSGTDVIGCGVNFRTGQAFFTKNGTDLGVAFRDIKGKLFPSIGMKKAGEQVRVNFGQSPFVFDIDGLIEREILRVRNEINSTSTAGLAPPLSETQLIQNLALQYLTHEGYVETARAFAGEVNEEENALNLDPTQVVNHHSVTEDEDAVHRQRIRTAVLEGDIDKALKHTNAYYPNVLADNEQIHFRLRCRKFIEMTRRGAEMSNSHSQQPPPQANNDASNGHHNSDLYDDTMASEMELDDDQPSSHHEDNGIDNEGANNPHAEKRSSSVAYTRLVEETIAYGTKLSADYGDDSRREVKKALGDVFSLMAYPNPMVAEPVKHLLDTRGRAVVAEELNSAILVSLGRSSTPALERVYQQTAVLLEDLGGPAAFVNLNGVLRGE